MPDDYSSTTQTTGAVAVGGSATGEIETSKDFDWFAVDLVAGHTYVIDLEGADSGGGALRNPVLRGLYDADGNRIAGTRDNDGGVGRDARLTFTAATTGTYYIEARGHSNQTGDYTVRVTEWVDTDAERGGAADLGDITGLAGPQFPAASLDGSSDSVDYWRFTLSEARRVGLGLRQQDANADLFLEDAEGNVLYSGTEDGTANEWISQTLLAGTYFVRVEAQEEGANEFKLRYGVSAANPAEVAALEQQQQQQQQGPDEAPAFVSGSYGFSLAENADGGTTPVSLGSVSATDPENSTITYSIESGDSGGLFAIDSGTGALSYQGTGEDYESGTTSYELTVRASDGGLHTDVTVTVNVIDVQEAPAFASGSYAFDLAENADGGATSVALGAVSATDPENSTITYSIESGDSGGLFAIDSETGALSYHGAGEDYESGTTSYELTVRASDGSLHSDVTVTVNVTDVEEYVILEQEATETQQSVSEPSGQDLPEGVSTTGRVAVGGSATGEVEFEGDRDWFAVELEAGRTYWIDLEGTWTGAGTLRDPYLRGVYDDNGVRIAGTTNDNHGRTANSRVDFTADDTGAYYVAAGSYGASRGTYTLSVAEVVDDFVAGTETSGVVAVGGSVTGVIETPGDVDWFAVTLEAGKIYRIDLEGWQTNEGTLYDPYLRGIHDANGDFIDSTTDDDGGWAPNSRATFRALEDGTYYVAAGANGRQDGTYRLSVVDVTDDFTAGVGTSGMVAVGGSATGDIDFRFDRDWFAVTLEAGKVYQFDLEGSQTQAGTLSDPYLHGVYDANRDLLPDTMNNDDGRGRNSRVIFMATEDATYYVAAGAFGSEQGTYTLSVEDVTGVDLLPDDFTAGVGTSGVVAVGGSATGEIEYEGDYDWFAVTLEADKNYRIDLKGSRTQAGALSDPYLYGVYDANGDLLPGTSNNDGGSGRNSRVIFTATEDATYYVVAGAFGSEQGTYTLAVTEFPDDFTAGVGTSGVVAVGGSATGEIDFMGDVDWFAVTLEAGKAYRIDLKGWETGDGTLWDPFLWGIHDADGNSLPSTSSDDGGGDYNSRVFFTAPKDATYYVAAGALGSEQGTYTLSVRENPDDFTAGVGTSGVVAVGGSATGEIETPGDVDWFAVTLEAGKIYQIDLEDWQNESTVYDPYLHGVYHADGVLLDGTTADDGGEGLNSRVLFTVPEAATYYVAARAFGEDEQGTYKLSMTDMGDDFEAGTGTSGAVEVGGSATSEIDIGGDRDWFAVTLEAGKVYQFDLEGSQTGAGTLRDPYLGGIHDANGNFIAGTTDDNSGAGLNSYVEFTPADAGTYYVAAGASGIRRGTYTLSVTEPTDDFATGTGTSGMVEVGGSATGEIDYGDDRDWFAVTLEAGRLYRIDLNGSQTGAGTLRDPYLRGIHDADGNLIPGTTDDNSGAGLNSRLEFTAGEDATYYVATGAWGDGEGTYTLSVVEVVDDFEAGTATSGAVAVDGSATGDIESEGDQDWFAVEFEAGRIYRIDLKGSETGDGTLDDPYLRGFYDVDGVLIFGTVRNDSGESYNSRLEFTAEEDATYYVAAGAFRGRTGTYTLSVTDVTDTITDDFSAGTGTSGAVEVGGSATGEIEFFTDRDWFAVDLEAGATYRIDLEGQRTGAGTLNDPYLYGVHDANGVLIAGTTDDDSGTAVNSRLKFTAADAATYYVAAGAYGDEEGTYTLTVVEDSI